MLCLVLAWSFMWWRITIHVIGLQVIQSPDLCDKIVFYTFYSPLVDVQTNAGYNFDKQELLYLFIYIIISLSHITLQNSFWPTRIILYIRILNNLSYTQRNENMLNNLSWMTYQDSSIQEKGRQEQNLTDLPVKCQEGLTEPCDGLWSGITTSTNKTIKYCSFKKSWQDKTRIHKPSIKKKLTVSVFFLLLVSACLSSD